jgi:hypothetical protein
MKCLGREAKEILNKLVSMTIDGYAKISNSNFMAVVVEWITQDTVSIAHYGEQNGDLMADPEMLFWRNDDEWYPYYYLNHYVGIEQSAIEFSNNRPVKINQKLQGDLASFANGWMKNIKEQQGL